MFHRKKENFTSFSAIAFQVFFASFVILFIIEVFIPGFVTSWFNPIWLLIIALISGIIATIKD